MTELDNNGQPSLREMSRRLNYLEGRLDAKTLSTDVWAAEKAGLSISIKGIEHRLEQLESGQSAAVKMLIGFFLGLVTQAVFLIVYVTRG
jgi:hypothetical protein